MNSYMVAAIYTL